MSPEKTTPTVLLGTTLVVGGCGFLGYHLVRHLLEDNESDAVYVFDRDTERNKHKGATYVRGSITDSEQLGSLVAEIRPRVIFHMASPMASLSARREGEFFETNVRGTELLLTVAARSEYVQALVYTSTVDIYANPPHKNASEIAPLWSPSDMSNEYNRTKSIADVLVRAANCTQLRTVTLRLGHAYGERHVQGMVEVLDTCSNNQKLVQVGRGDNLMDVVSSDNAAIAHVLAAKALLDPTRAAGKVDGEDFNISDGAPVPFWHHIKVIWGVVRGEDALEHVMVLPAWVMIVVVYAVEWALRILTLNTIKPPVQLRRLSLNYCLNTHTYNIDKAMERLGFNPISNHDEILEQSARWMIHHREAME